MSNKSFSQLINNINSAPLLVTASVTIVGLMIYKCIPGSTRIYKKTKRNN